MLFCVPGLTRAIPEEQTKMGYIALFARFVGEIQAFPPVTRLHRFAARLCSTRGCPAMGTEAAPSLVTCYLSCNRGSRIDPIRLCFTCPGAWSGFGDEQPA